MKKIEKEKKKERLTYYLLHIIRERKIREMKRKQEQKREAAWLTYKLRSGEKEKELRNGNWKEDKLARDSERLDSLTFKRSEREGIRKKSKKEGVIE